MFRALELALLLTIVISSAVRADEMSNDAYKLVAFAAALNASSGGGVPGTVLGDYAVRRVVNTLQQISLIRVQLGAQFIFISCSSAYRVTD
jgi:hypothetical protein